MGIADSVPGVSGGTVALLLGFYPRLVMALSKFKTSLIMKFLKSNFQEVW